VSGDSEILARIPGVDQVVARFGEWPSFHDAEIIELDLNRRRTSRLRIHTWGKTNGVNERGEYVFDKHAVVTFELEDVTDLELADFSHQNVIFDLQVEPSDDGFRLTLWPSYGLAGWIKARVIRVGLEPGEPPPGE
jgi:hypothetical protein